ncbi:MAG TPA: hypothetical protein VK425_12485, partial [Acidimicrobiales bacterium]|nr:hypothetical protein [Acidimicrobiales bacterium]
MRITLVEQVFLYTDIIGGSGAAAVSFAPGIPLALALGTLKGTAIRESPAAQERQEVAAVGAYRVPAAPAPVNVAGLEAHTAEVGTEERPVSL